MKYIGFIFFAILLLNSCKDNPDEKFEMTFDVDNIVFEAGLSQFEVHFIDNYDISTLIEQTLIANGRNKDEITSILPKSAELINIQTNNSLDFIQNLSIRVFDGSQFTPEVVENITEIFFRENIPQDQRTFIDLIPSLPDVKDQLLEERFNVSVRAQLRVPPQSTIEARLKIRFSVQ